MGLNHIGKRAMIALREPSLGPCFGMKGGATGGGYTQVLPSEDINLHFTGDFHAVTSANNLIAALLDNYLYHNRSKQVGLKKVMWRRVLDMNDRSLRHIVSGLGGSTNGIPTETGFDITPASEIMAILCLARNIDDLYARIGRIVLGVRYDDTPFTVEDLGVTGAVVALLKDAINPNLVQTTEHNPVIIHGGPFANIAHGCNSVVATKLALATSDYVITEAGFGSDLGAEKFLDVKCRIAELNPSVIVLVATLRGIKFHGRMPEDFSGDAKEFIDKGLQNLYRHIDTLKNSYNKNVVVTINKFISDTKDELDFVISRLKERNVDAVVNECYAKGGEGTLELADAVLKNIAKSELKFVYNLNDKVEDKIEAIVKKVYGGDGVTFSDCAQRKLEFINKNNLSNLPIIIAKTQFSFTDDKKNVGAPTGFSLNVRDIEIKTGSGFIVAIAGDMMLMPGLSKIPNAEKIDMLANGTIIGLS